jgi:Tfp pilus assembly protein PilX
MKIAQRPEQAGVALLIVIMALLIVTAVAAGMMIYSTSETKVDANYRDEQVALYAAKAGLEEARNRILSSSSNSISSLLPCVLPGGAAGQDCTNPTTNPTAQVLYIVANNNSQPWSSSSTLGNTSLFDSEFACELGSCTGTNIPTYNSTTSLTAYSGPTPNQIPYQWVRINLKTNKTVDTATGGAHWVNSSLSSKPSAQVLFDSASGTECVYGSASGPCATSGTLEPVYEITSYAVTPSGTIRMMQDDVAAYTFNLSFPSALTLPGPLGSFNPPNSKGYCMDGNDTSQASSVSGCSYTPPPAVAGCTSTGASTPAVGVTAGDIWNSTTVTNQQYVTNQIPRPSNYIGSTGTTPSIGNVNLPFGLSSPSALEQELSAIQQNANVCLGCSGSGGGTYTFSSIDSASGSLWGGTSGCGTNCGTTPQVTYVNGNMDISGSNTGSGILVVTGNLTYDGNSSWNGIILVVGDGLTTYVQNGGGNGQFNGAIFVADIATTGCASGQTQCYGPADFTINGGGGNGVYYNSCWINSVQKPTNYVVLSSKEISQ